MDFNNLSFEIWLTKDKRTWVLKVKSQELQAEDSEMEQGEMSRRVIRLKH